MSVMRLALSAVLVGFFSVAFAQPQVGVYRWDAPNGPANVDGFSQWLGRPVSVAAAFEANDSWGNIDGAEWQLGPWSQWVAAQAGRNLSLAVPMLPQSGATLASCAAGQYDIYWTNLANNLAYYRLQSAYLRLGWEMDGGWYAWGAPQGSGKEASYAGCFRRIVQVMRQTQPASQWKFVWNPTTAWWGAAYLDAVWPGDAYVDLVGIDLYDQSWVAGTYPYPADCSDACRLAAQQTAWNDYSWKLATLRDFGIAHGKPMAIPEWGVAIRPDGHGGGDNTYFMQKMIEFIGNPANRVVYHAYFNVTAVDIDARLTDPVTGDNPGGATRFPNSAAVYRQFFGTGATTPSSDTTPPEVSLVAPADGTVLGRNMTLTMAANASDNVAVAVVDFSVNGKFACRASSAPYTCSWYSGAKPVKTYSISATAVDTSGNRASDTRTFSGR